LTLGVSMAVGKLAARTREEGAATEDVGGDVDGARVKKGIIAVSFFFIFFYLFCSI
jgi:hypothetical protein